MPDPPGTAALTIRAEDTIHIADIVMPCDEEATLPRPDIRTVFSARKVSPTQAPVHDRKGTCYRGTSSIDECRIDCTVPGYRQVKVARRIICGVCSPHARTGFEQRPLKRQAALAAQTPRMAKQGRYR